MPLNGGRVGALRGSRLRGYRQGRLKTAGCAGVVLPPSSREEAIRQARNALNVGLGRRGSKGSSDLSVKQRISRGNKRLLLEFPLPRDTADDVASLARDLVEEVASEKTVLCFGSREACQRAKALNLANCYHADESIPKQLKATSLVMVCVNESQASFLLGSRWQSVILINPKGFSERTSKVAGSFETVYQFLPLLVQGFLFSKSEGALLKCLSDSEGPESSKWNIFLKDGKSFRRIASQSSRPDEDELELALYNNVASSNPVIKGMKSVKSKVDEMFSK